MATAEEVRAWLRDQGEDVPGRARIRKELRDKFDAAHPADTGDDEVTAAAEPGPDMTEAVPRTPATRPRGQSSSRPAGTSASTWAHRIWGKARDAGKPPKGKKGPAWVSTATVIEHVWSQLAWSARPLPPVAKILAAQAPMAGVMLEDAARDTFIDRVFLQPAARAEARLQAANAMLGPPLWTFAIATVGGAQSDPATGMPMVVVEDGRTMTAAAAAAAHLDAEYLWDGRTQAMIGGLRFSLMSWLKVGGKRVDEIKEAAEQLADLGDQADELIRWILAPAAPGQSPKQAEREAAERGTAFIAGERPRAAAAGKVPPAATQDDITAHLEGMAAGSALRPAPAGKP